MNRVRDIILVIGFALSLAVMLYILIFETPLHWFLCCW